ncbi:PREDICTED: E3 ubiquitin-protein ligase Praja-2-like isoform X2 [Ipomoea nil]|uniref:E3 ubiquitin-protein ligase Praja-2-like isoform X2 n=1 Tax=Ipomoea nil TaxID=35883 RepID=UPI0009012983|nr:PREDICTED: E3 ubiquitin-protein ligase Praja-2-like isoform X2 [Ipomoea nil]XP_019196092.1 PREDICTED: E3 ubiquitin-protein ligase Praja-2-like isoform X2 [Ipomoea nil]XP_019196094.1 PREDICTED: E3 ubiquitin-protein ligase Praja-2-like isoform X2 [Ipomoea nil]
MNSNSEDTSGTLTSCVLCLRILTSDNDASDVDSINLCSDCKFLLLEDLDSPIRDVYRWRTSGLRRTRQNQDNNLEHDDHSFDGDASARSWRLTSSRSTPSGPRRWRLTRTRYNSSSESIENLFSQQFSHLINLARQNQDNNLEHDDHSVNENASTRSWQQTNSRTTPNGSRRWRVPSDTESDVIDSVFSESESNLSFSGYRVMHSENETVSYSAYGGSSTASVDGSSFLGIGNSADEGSDLDTDTDIDPMRAGMYPWDSDQEEDDNEWQEADSEENTVGVLGGRSLQRSVTLHESTWGRLGILSAEFEGTIDSRIQERIRAQIAGISNDLEELELHANFVDADYLDARGLDELVEHLAETDGFRRGAPPAAVSVVNSLPRIVIKDHKQLDDLACAVCKDSLFVGTVVNQLPCSHVYHPSCILPWLSSRNTCPLCRYELPTDDQDYEDRKLRNGNEFAIRETQQHDMNEGSSSDDTEAMEPREFGRGRTEQGEVTSMSGSSTQTARGRWFFLAAAAPVISVVGIAIALWFGNPLTEQSRSSILRALCPHREPSNHAPHSQRVNNRERRWWSPF